MLVTELGMTMDVKLSHPKKACFQMLVTELGMTMDVNLLQPLKA